MVEIDLVKIRYCSSEHPSFPSSNILLKTDSFQWKCRYPGEKQIVIEFEFDKPRRFEKIRIDNNGSFFIEVLVRDTSVDPPDFKVLVRSNSLMSQYDAVSGSNLNSGVVYDCASHFLALTSNQAWDLVRIVCSQPFNPTLHYGLSTVRFWEAGSEQTCKAEQIVVFDVASMLISGMSGSDSVGSLFANRASFKTDDQLPKMSQSMSVNRGSPLQQPRSQVDPNLSTKFEAKQPSGPLTTPHSHVNPQSEQPSAAHQTKKSLNSSIHLHNQSMSTYQTHLSSNQSSSSAIQTPQSHNQQGPSHIDPSSTNRPLSRVVFVLSGYQNPLRDSLRRMAVSMGAVYRPSWSNDCTHLICAFSNTPKFREVSGKGFIVSDKWVSDCYTARKCISWRPYRLTGALSPVHVTSDSDPASSSTSPDVPSEESVSSKRLKTSESEIDTDDEIESVLQQTVPSKVNLPELPTIFLGKEFFFYGSFNEADRRYLKRMILVFGGILHDYMAPDVDCVITSSLWDNNFDMALYDHPNILFLRPGWIEECDSEGKLVPFENHRIVK